MHYRNKKEFDDPFKALTDSYDANHALHRNEISKNEFDAVFENKVNPNDYPKGKKFGVVQEQKHNKNDRDSLRNDKNKNVHHPPPPPNKGNVGRFVNGNFRNDHVEKVEIHDDDKEDEEDEEVDPLWNSFKNNQKEYYMEQEKLIKKLMNEKKALKRENQRLRQKLKKYENGK